MGLFTPHKKRPNQFRYKPRYFDPEKEAREQRRRELCGQSNETDEMEYTPGLYLRTQRDARNDGAPRRQKIGASRSLVVTIGVMAVVVIGALALYQRLLKMPKNRPVTQFEQAEREVRDFDPTVPIEVVPNDGADSVMLKLPNEEE